MKKTRTLIIILCLLLAAALGVTAFFSLNLASGDHQVVKIGVVVYNSNDTFLSSMMAEFETHARTYEAEHGIKIDINLVGSMESQTTQNKQVERFISLGYDVLVVNLVDRTNASYIINKAMDADIPVVFFNREPVQGDMTKWDKLFYVGSDARNSAELEAKIVIDKYNSDPLSIDLNGDGIIQYVMLEGERRHQDAMIRTEYSVQTLRESGLILEKVDGGVGNWDLGQAKAITEKIMTEHGDEVELIICNNDDMALGAAKAIKELGLDFFNIVGIDGTTPGLAAVDEGRMLGTVKVNVADHAKAILDLSCALALGEDAYSATDWTIGEDKSIRVSMAIYIQQSR